MSVSKWSKGSLYVELTSLGSEGPVEFCDYWLFTYIAVVVTWQWFDDMFCDEYVPLVEKERMTHEYLSLRKMMEIVTEITKMIHERALFRLESASSE